MDVLKIKRTDILRLAALHGARHVRVFGSIARGEAGPASDIDLLVQMDNGRSLLDLIELTQELESVLQRKVDVLTDEGLSPYLKERIQAEAVPL
ncbi:MAG: nucleotidyltransferase family protein [Nitrospira sp.]|nr:nucleotidyltransferase family protein [Nitrospira sp.]MDH4370727.1 nucleotidyltransferase family protein [Nitrospira sp.]MDH5347354.1 nucleotidyltransferase family protein [Nitrospira sp.]MDH5495900.1 nucleotidyltransferase family protein [Nitrospira sp.]